MATERVITVADVARALGVAESVEAIHEGLVADGIRIVADWDGSAAVSLADAQAVVTKHRKAQAEWEARTRRELDEQHEGHLAQLEFDRLCGEYLLALRREDPYGVSHAQERQRYGEARRLAYLAISEKYPPAALSKVHIKPTITTAEPSGESLARLIPVAPPMSLDEIKKPRGLRARLANAVGGSTEPEVL